MQIFKVTAPTLRCTVEHIVRSCRQRAALYLYISRTGRIRTMCMATCLQTSKLCEYRVSNVQVEAILHTLGLVTPPYDRITCYNPILRLHKSQGNISSGRRAHILPPVRGACSKVKPKIQVSGALR